MEKSYSQKLKRLALLQLLFILSLTQGCKTIGDYGAAQARDLSQIARARMSVAVGLYAEAEATSLLRPAVGALDWTLAPKLSLEWDPRQQPKLGEVRTAALPLLLVGWPIYGYQEGQSGYGDTHPYWRAFLAPYVAMGNRHIEGRTHGLLWLDQLITNPRLNEPDKELRDPGKKAPEPLKLADHFWVGASVTPLVGRFDIGLNPLEFLDFLTGIFGWDLLKDNSASLPTEEGEKDAASKTKSSS